MREYPTSSPNSQTMRQRQIKIIETTKVQSTQKKKSIRNGINEYLATTTKKKKKQVLEIVLMNI